MKKYIFNFHLLLATLPLSTNTAHAADVLLVHLNSTTQTVSFGDIQNLSFVDNNLSVKALDGNAVLYALEDIEKITLGDVIITELNNLSVPNNIDVVVYYTSWGKLVVESLTAIQSLSLFTIDGKILRTIEMQLIKSSTAVTVDVSILPFGIYLLQIETMQGIVVKKIIKQ